MNLEKVMCDFVALHDMFEDLSLEGERKVKHKVRLMLDTEAYRYLKYRILCKALKRIERGVTGAAEPSLDFIQSAEMGDSIAKSLDIKEKEPRVSHFRGLNSEK